MEDGNGSSHEDELAALRSDPRFAEVVCFLRTFSRVLRLRPLSCDELEAALLAPARWTALLAELHGRLTRRSHELSAPWRVELEPRWVVRLARYVGERKSLWAGARESPFRGRAPPAAYAALTPVKRVRATRPASSRCVRAAGLTRAHSLACCICSVRRGSTAARRWLRASGSRWRAGRRTRFARCRSASTNAGTSSSHLLISSCTRAHLVPQATVLPPRCRG